MLRTLKPHVLILIGIMSDLLLTPPISSAADEASPPAVELEVEIPYQKGEIDDPSAATI